MGDNVTKGISTILIVFALWSVMDVGVKYVSTALPHSQVMIIRFASQIILVWLLFHGSSTWALFKTDYPLLHLIRSSLLFAAAMLNIYAVQFLPLTLTTVIFLSAPIMVCVISGLFLREYMGVRRIVAVIIGFVGVGIAIDPVGGKFEWPMVASLASAFSFAVFSVLTRVMRDKSSAEQQSVLGALVPAALLMVPAATGWQPIQGVTVWAALIALAVGSTIASYLMSIAHQFAPASILAPFLYTMIVWNSVLSWLIFNEPLTLQQGFGSAVVVCSGLYIWWRERYLSKEGELSSSAPTRNVLFRR